MLSDSPLSEHSSHPASGDELALRA